MLVPISAIVEAEEDERRLDNNRPKLPKRPKRLERVSQGQRRQQAAARRASAKVAKKKSKKSDKRVEKSQKTREQRRKRSMKSALAQAAQVRRERRTARKKEAEAAGKVKKGKAAVDMVPAQVAHCIMAVQKGGKSARAAWNICRWSLTKHGYLKGPYRANTKLPKATRQTQKGVRRTFQHSMEKKPLGGGVPGTGATKYAKFKKMFRSLEPDLVPKRGL